MFENVRTNGLPGGYMRLALKLAKIFIQAAVMGAILIGLGLWAEEFGERECVGKGVALGAAVKFYHGRCYVRGYSDVH